MIHINLNKAKEIAHNIRRKARQKEFQPYDDVISKQIPGEINKAEEQRKAIRKKYDTIQTEINTSATIEELTNALSLKDVQFEHLESKFIDESFQNEYETIKTNVEDIQDSLNETSSKLESIENNLTVLEDSVGTQWLTENNFEEGEWVDICASSCGKYRTAVGYRDSIYTSNDYGITWIKRSLQNLNWFGISMSHDGQVQMATVNGGEGSYVYVSTDFGVNWIPSSEEKEWGRICLSREGKLAAVIESYEGKIYLSTDLGTTWSAVDSPSGIYTDISVSRTGKIQCATIQGLGIIVSKNYGKTWSLYEVSDVLRSISVSASGKYMTAIAGDGLTPGNIYTSSDFGATWNTKLLPKLWSCVNVSNDGKYQIVTTEDSTCSEIYVSINFGETWTLKHSQTEPKSNINSCCITNNAGCMLACGKKYNYVSQSNFGITLNGKRILELKSNSNKDYNIISNN